MHMFGALVLLMSATYTVVSPLLGAASPFGAFLTVVASAYICSTSLRGALGHALFALSLLGLFLYLNVHPLGILLATPPAFAEVRKGVAKGPGA